MKGTGSGPMASNRTRSQGPSLTAALEEEEEEEEESRQTNRLYKILVPATRFESC
jgi:hypothetical protein